LRPWRWRPWWNRQDSGAVRCAALARSDRKPAYTVARNRTLAQIAARRPATPARLAAISGLDPAFIERHGKDVIAVV
jgi:superfamily II DNA helicase RecQ